MVKYAIALVIALVLNASANLMIKFGMRGIDLELQGTGLLSGGLMGGIRLMLRHWILPLGLACFAANVVFYSYALQKLPISVAYPIMSICGFTIIIVVAGALLQERLTTSQWLGVAAILVGVLLVAKDAGRQMGPAGRSTEAGGPGAATPRVLPTPGTNTVP